LKINIAQPQIGKEEIQAVTAVLKSGMIAQGPKVAELEEKFAKFIGVKYAIATSSGTTASLPRRIQSFTPALDLFLSILMKKHSILIQKISRKRLIRRQKRLCQFIFMARHAE